VNRADQDGAATPGGTTCIRVLGTLDVITDGGRRIALSSPKLRRLLAVLLIDAGAVVSVDRLADAIWGDAPPVNVAGALHNLVSRLRALLRPAASSGCALLTTAPGYVLELGTTEVDAARFERHAREARDVIDTEPHRAAALLDEALDLWHGDAYAEFVDDEFARVEAARLDELRMVAREDRVAVALAIGRPDDAVVLGERLVAAQPLRERPHALLMRALYRAGRHADALAVYRTFRERVGAELGLDPSAELQQLERDILRGDPGLHPAPAVPQAAAGSVAAPPPRDPGNLPTAPEELVGRAGVLAGVAEALRAGRVLTLTGPGGVGKTSVALRVATNVAGAWPDGAWWCDLAPVSGGGAVAEVVTTVLGVQPRQGRTAIQRIVEFLSGTRRLLVLDNGEHVVDAVAELAAAVVRGCPGVAVLVTSRERLGVDREHVLTIPPLPVPAPGAAGDPRQAPAVELFARRAAAVTGGFAMTDDNAEVVADICRRLDGMPLALELAATRMRSMSPADLAGRLSWRFRLLRGGERTGARRHRSLRAVVDWSYQLLDDPARLVFDRLSVFAGTFTLAAAEAVVAGTGEGVDALDVADVIADLVDCSMVVARTDDATTRYTLLETLRAYGRERLHDRGETRAAQRAHARYHVTLAETAAVRLYGPERMRWAQVLDGALGELRAAHAWALDHDIEVALRIVVALSSHAEEALVAEPFEWALRAVQRAEADGHASSWLAQGYAVAAMGARFGGDLPRAQELVDRALTVDGHPDRPARQLPLLVRGEVAFYRGELDEAQRIRAQLAGTQPHDAERTWALWSEMIGVIAPAYRGDTAEAINAGERFVVRVDRDGDPIMMGWARYALAEAIADSDPVRALALLDDALARARASGGRFLNGVALVTAASLRGRHGQPEQARRVFAETIRWWLRAGNWTQQWTTVRNVIDLLVRLGQDRHAARLHGAVLARTTAPPPFGADAQRLALARTTLRERLGAEAFAAASGAGAAMSDGEVITWVLELLDP
jgi:predicted ATPase/DNA-binding SARP family transcriptional activator